MLPDTFSSRRASTERKLRSWNMACIRLRQKVSSGLQIGDTLRMTLGVVCHPPPGLRSNNRDDAVTSDWRLSLSSGQGVWFGAWAIGCAKINVHLYIPHPTSTQPNPVLKGTSVCGEGVRVEQTGSEGQSNLFILVPSVVYELPNVVMDRTTVKVAGISVVTTITLHVASV